jgi:hypothetical protein
MKNKDGQRIIEFIFKVIFIDKNDINYFKACGVLACVFAFLRRKKPCQNPHSLSLIKPFPLQQI